MPQADPSGRFAQRFFHRLGIVRVVVGEKITDPGRELAETFDLFLDQREHRPERVRRTVGDTGDVEIGSRRVDKLFQAHLAEILPVEPVALFEIELRRLCD